MTAERRRFRARTDALARVISFVERRCRRLGGGRQAALRLALIAEELFANAVGHGYGGDSRRTVEFVLRAAGREIELVVTDRAPPFDPFDRLAAADPRLRRVGGLGRVLVAGLASRHAYERHGACNRVTVAVPRLAGAPLHARVAKKTRRNAHGSFR